MAIAIVEPALVAALLAGPALTPRTPPVVAISLTSASPCRAGAPSTTGFDCCLHLPIWKAPTAAPVNHPARSPDEAAADQKEGQ